MRGVTNALPAGGGLKVIASGTSESNFSENVNTPGVFAIATRYSDREIYETVVLTPGQTLKDYSFSANGLHWEYDMAALGSTFFWAILG